MTIRSKAVQRIFDTGGPHFLEIIQNAEYLGVSAWACQDAISPSPIEELMATALCFVIDCFFGKAFYHNQIGLTEEEAVDDFMKQAAKDNRFAVYPEVTIGSCRVDFLVLFLGAGDLEGIVVECDGHDFHERTKEQASRDKARDRALQKSDYKGLPLLRGRYMARPYWLRPRSHGGSPN